MKIYASPHVCQQTRPHAGNHTHTHAAWRLQLALEAVRHIHTCTPTTNCTLQPDWSLTKLNYKSPALFIHANTHIFVCVCVWGVLVSPLWQWPAKWCASHPPGRATTITGCCSAIPFCIFLPYSNKDFSKILLKVALVFALQTAPVCLSSGS